MVKRFVVWSPRVQTCMAWDSRKKAERFAEFWCGMALLGCRDWRVAAIDDEPLPRADAPAAPGAEASPDPEPEAANDALATARDELLEVLATKDARIADLQRELNDTRLSAVREAVAQGRRIEELEQQVAALTRGRARTR